MLKIGDFSRLSRVTVKTLRYYDEVGLLAPVQVDTFTGYRYYSASQLPRLNRILALKEFGFSLEQIGQVLNENLSIEQLRGMLRLKRAEAEQKLGEEQGRLARIEARLRQIEQENTMSNYEVVIKKVEPQLVASARGVVPNYQSVGPLFGELYGHLARFGAMDSLGGSIWHDESYKEKDVDTEAVAYLKNRVPEAGRVKVYELPGGTMACVVHNGAYNKLNLAYEAVGKWIEANGYKIAGPGRELYLHATQPVRQDDESYVTEIQFPVEKA